MRVVERVALHSNNYWQMTGAFSGQIPYRHTSDVPATMVLVVSEAAGHFVVARSTRFQSQREPNFPRPCVRALAASLGVLQQVHTVCPKGSGPKTSYTTPMLCYTVPAIGATFSGIRKPSSSFRQPPTQRSAYDSSEASLMACPLHRGALQSGAHHQRDPPAIRQSAANFSETDVVVGDLRDARA